MNPLQQEVSRARAIFNASEEAKPFDPADFDFAMTDEEPSADRGAFRASGIKLCWIRSTAQNAQKATCPWHDALQLAVIAALGLALVCILAGVCLSCL